MLSPKYLRNYENDLLIFIKSHVHTCTWPVDVPTKHPAAVDGRCITTNNHTSSSSLKIFFHNTDFPFHRPTTQWYHQAIAQNCILNCTIVEQIHRMAPLSPCSQRPSQKTYLHSKLKGYDYAVAA